MTRKWAAWSAMGLCWFSTTQKLCSHTRRVDEKEERGKRTSLVGINSTRSLVIYQAAEREFDEHSPLRAKQ